MHEQTECMWVVLSCLAGWQQCTLYHRIWVMIYETLTCCEGICAARAALRSEAGDDEYACLAPVANAAPNWLVTAEVAVWLVRRRIKELVCCRA